jgi:hypothetical protein
MTPRDVSGMLVYLPRNILGRLNMDDIQEEEKEDKEIQIMLMMQTKYWNLPSLWKS